MNARPHLRFTCHFSSTHVRRCSFAEWIQISSWRGLFRDNHTLRALIPEAMLGFLCMLARKRIAERHSADASVGAEVHSYRSFFHSLFTRNAFEIRRDYSNQMI